MNKGNALPVNGEIHGQCIFIYLSIRKFLIFKKCCECGTKKVTRSKQEGEKHFIIVSIVEII